MAVIKSCGDRELLERFVDSGDDAAFEALVERHGRLVRGVCGRVLNDPGRADDATQATFVLLARHAHRLRLGAGSLGPWLHRVARNAAVQAWRADRARRHRERSVAQGRDEGQSATGAPCPWADLLPFLEEEIHRLPDRYRALLVLHYYEDRTQQEVADAMGLSYGTLRRRLDRARDLLRSRLARRGVAIGSALLGQLLWETAASASAPNLGWKGSEVLTDKALGSLGLDPETLSLASRVDRQLRFGMPVKTSIGLAAAGALLVALAQLLPQASAEVALPGAAVGVVEKPPAPAPAAEVDPAPAPIPEPQEQFAKGGPAGVELPPFIPVLEVFQGEIAVNGQNRRFDNQAEFEKAAKGLGMPGFDRIKPSHSEPEVKAEKKLAPDSDKVDERSGAAEAEFVGEILIIGKLHRFDRLEDYERAKNSLFRP